MYWHESEERKPNKHPMCTEFPVQHTVQHNMEQYLIDRKLDPGVARANGWYESNACGDKCNRVVIPAVTHKAGHVYWQARDIFGHSHIRYQSPKGPRHEALVQVTPESSKLGVVVVEGPFCALGAAQAGYMGYALMGMKPSASTLMHLCLLLEDHKDLPVLVMLDRDSAEAAVHVATFVSSQGYRCKIGHFTKSKDLAELLPNERAKLLRTYFRTFDSSKRKRR